MPAAKSSPAPSDGQFNQIELDRLALDCGKTLSPCTIAHETYGTLNAAKNNVILVCHALTMDQYAASKNPLSDKKGWWQHLIGPGLPLDTDRFFIICQNVIGGCMGSTGPASKNADGEIYGLDFPSITIGDMVRAQKQALEKMGIDELLCVIGGSMGGMQALQWAVDYPDKVFACVPIAAAAYHTAQNIAFHEVGRQAIMADPNWHQGDYTAKESRPTKGLAVARMAAHITYLSELALHRKFGRNLQNRDALSYGFEADFQIESYLRHQGFTFVDRFDANAYLYITRAMDYFDLAAEHGGSLAKAFAKTPVRFCLISFSSDWLFPPAESRKLVHALNGAGANVSFVEIESDKGHDAFLLDEPEMTNVLKGFLNAAALALGLPVAQIKD